MRWRGLLLTSSVTRKRAPRSSAGSVYDSVVHGSRPVRSGKHVGCAEPRLFTRPLRELTPETSHGFSVIEFALTVLGINLYPWQKVLLIRALELNEDGTYRFRKIFILVGRQNGKTLLLTVLSLWWLFMDADSFPEHLPANEFLILGTAQNLDLAEESWDAALKRCDPMPDDDDQEYVIDLLAAETRRPVKTNGKKSLRLKNNARYEPRAASRMGGRGKSAARVIMDEMREQQTWDIWGAVSKTKNAIFNSQLWGISSAGDSKSIVLATLRKGQVKAIENWERYVESGIQTVEEYANTHDLATALFEWSAPDGADLLDIDGILQANPSVGHKPMFFESIWSDLLGDEPESTKRTEILCQWVTALVETYIDGEQWQACADAPVVDERGQLVSAGSEITEDSRITIGIDTSGDRAMSFVSVAGYRVDGLPMAETIVRRAGMLWVVPFVEKLAEKQGTKDVALQTRGCPAAEFAQPLREAGLNVIEIAGTALGASAGQVRDKVRDGLVRHRGQPELDMAVSGAVTKKLGEVRVWDRNASVVDIASLVSFGNALYALENTDEPEDAASAYEEHDLLVV